METKTKVVLRSEDLDHYNINLLGIFDDRYTAIIWITAVIDKEIEEIEKDTQHYEKEGYSFQDYVAHIKQKLRKRISEWLDYLNTPLPSERQFKKRTELEQKRTGFEWGGSKYIFEEMPYFGAS